MRVYFLSSRPCLLKINGEVAGKTDGFERFVPLSPQDQPFIEFLPVGPFSSLRFFLNEEVLERPPAGVEIYLLAEGLAVYAKEFSSFSRPLTLLTKKVLDNGQVTLFSQGTPQVLINFENEEQVTTLNHAFIQCKISNYGNLTLLEGEGEVCALYRTTELFRGRIEDWRFDVKESELFIKAPLDDFCARTVSYRWQIAPKGFSLLSRQFSPPKLPKERFLLCALLQNLLLDDGVEALLDDSLAQRLPTLREYLGHYIKIVPLPHALSAAAVYPKGKIFTVKYFSAELQGGKICNIFRRA